MRCGCVGGTSRSAPGAWRSSTRFRAWPRGWRHTATQSQNQGDAQMKIRPLEPRDRPGLQAFLRRIPEGDKTFFKEPIDDEAHVASWFEPAGTRWLAVAGDEVLGYVA